MKTRIFILLSLAVVLFACEKDNPDDLQTNKSTVSVIVIDMDKNPVTGADVLIIDPLKINPDNPEYLGFTKQTNNEGLATFLLDTGYYAITSFKETIGSAGVLLEIKGLVDTTLELMLMPEDFINYPPQIQRLAPAESYIEVSSLDYVNLKLKITDDHSDYSKINVKVACETDGVLFEGNPDNTNVVDVTVSDLAKGYHQLTITATDEYNASSTSLFTIDVVIVVPVELSVEKVNRQAVLSWSEILEPDFDKLVIERYNPNVYSPAYEVITTITDKSIATYTDTLLPIAEYLDYRVKVYDTDNRKSDESIARIELPRGPFFNLDYYSVTHAILHPVNDWVYINVNDEANKIIIYDFANEQIVNEIVLDYEPRHPIIADNGNGLQVFVAGDNSAINIYSADENFTLEQTINTEEDVNSVIPNGNGILIAGMDNYYYNYRDYHVRTFSQSTGQLIDSVGDRYAKALIVGDPLNKNVVYGIERTTSNYARIKCEIDNTGKFINYEYNNAYDYRINSRAVFVSPTGAHFMLGYAVYRTADLTSGLDLGSVNHTGITFNHDASLIYTCNRSDQKIIVYSYPELQLVGDIETLTYPGKILIRDNKIVTVGNENGFYIVEMYDLN